ncbi:MAG: hypothetical protein MHM6MM_000084 [Cercozoa sp. M6MM]
MQPRFFSAHAVPNRDESFASLNEEDVTFFKSILDEENVLTDAGELEPYNEDWLRTWTGRSQVVLRPRTTEEVSQVLKHCNERHLAVVPQGGNTGLVGGSVPVHDEIVLSTSRMRDIEQVDTQGGIVVAQSGVVLEELDTHLAQHGLAVPLDLGAKGSCQIGGNVSTNAGGIRLCRYGSLHGSVLGLEAVLPDGRILDLCTALRKDNTGYDLKQLFIGAEGTLGVVTKVAMLAVPRPKSTQLALFACDNFDSVLALSMKARECLGEIVSAIEFGDAASFNTVAEHIQGARNPFEEEHAFFVVIESQGSNEEHDSAKFEAFLETALGEIDGVNDGVVAMDERQVREIWLLRESCAEALVKSGATYKYDISIPVSEFEHFVQMTQCRIDESDLPNKENLHACGYGHLGDGNLHLNVHSPGDFEHHKAVVGTCVY